MFCDMVGGRNKREKRVNHRQCRRTFLLCLITFTEMAQSITLLISHNCCLTFPHNFFFLPSTIRLPIAANQFNDSQRTIINLPDNFLSTLSLVKSQKKSEVLMLFTCTIHHGVRERNEGRKKKFIARNSREWEKKSFLLLLRLPPTLLLFICDINHSWKINHNLYPSKSGGKRTRERYLFILLAYAL